MLAGHYAAAYALKAARPAVPLWALALMVQAVDIAFFVLVLSGVETMSIDRSELGLLGMHLEHIPFTHSLTANLLYSAVVVAIAFMVKRAAAGLVLAAALLSHWCFDLIVHVKDLPLTMAGETRVGLGLWRVPMVALAVELGLVVVSFLALRRSLRPGPARRCLDGSVVLLCVAQLLVVFSPLPATTLRMALAAEAIYVGVAILSYQVDRRLRV